MSLLAAVPLSNAKGIDVGLLRERHLTCRRAVHAVTTLGWLVLVAAGTNAGIVLQVQDIPKWQPDGIAPSTQTAINTEWGAYNRSQFLPNCKEDQELDKQSGAARGEYIDDCACNVYRAWLLCVAVSLVQRCLIKHCFVHTQHNNQVHLLTIQLEVNVSYAPTVYCTRCASLVPHACRATLKGASHLPITMLTHTLPELVVSTTTAPLHETLRCTLGHAPGEMLLEKMVSGLYLGDIARRILATFAEKTQLLGKVVPPLIREQGSFTTAMLSKIESDVTPFRYGILLGSPAKQSILDACASAA